MRAPAKLAAVLLLACCLAGLVSATAAPGESAANGVVINTVAATTARTSTATGTARTAMAATQLAPVPG